MPSVPPELPAERADEQPDGQPDDQHIPNNGVFDSAIRRLLIFIIVLLLPVIGALVFLNWQKTKQEAVDRDSTVGSVESPIQRAAVTPG